MRRSVEKKGRSHSANKPQNYWILGTRLSDEEPVTLGAFSPSNKPVFCTRAHAETIASSWASKPNPNDIDQPLYQEVVVIAATTDGRGQWTDPRWAGTANILTVVRPGRFAAFGKESQVSRFSQLQNAILGDKGREWEEGRSDRAC